MGTSGTLRAEERRTAILTALQRDGSVRLEHLATTLAVSPMTVRRDFDDMAAEGLLRRVRGGAVLTSGPQPFGERRLVRSRAKRIIAVKASALVPDAGAVAFDASSTSGTIASAIPSRNALTIATNSFENFAVLRAVQGVTPVLIGGEAEAATGSFVGMIACEGAASMLYQRFFVSATAVDPVHGSSEVSLAESQVKRAFAGRSREVVLCVDSSKLGHRSVALGFPFEEITVMITDLDPADPQLQSYRDLVELR